MMQQVRIVRVPQGEAPLEVRQAWVGLILPVSHFGEGLEVGLKTGMFQPKRAWVAVPRQLALEILESKDPVAAKWFKDSLGERTAVGHFAFGRNEIEELT